MLRESRILLIGVLGTILLALLIVGRDPATGDLFSPREFTGTARVVDGDSLEIAQRRVRLFGIDAPEIGQSCANRAGRSYACGERARDEIEGLVDGHVLRCVSEGNDRFGRVLARCRTPSGEDIGAAIVRAGWAVAYHGNDGRTYRTAESEAARRRVGLWSGSFERPETWRRDHPSR